MLLLSCVSVTLVYILVASSCALGLLLVGLVLCSGPLSFRLMKRHLHRTLVTEPPDSVRSSFVNLTVSRPPSVSSTVLRPPPGPESWRSLSRALGSDLDHTDSQRVSWLTAGVFNRRGADWHGPPAVQGCLQDICFQKKEDAVHDSKTGWDVSADEWIVAAVW